jgi:hypothetical protein
MVLIVVVVVVVAVLVLVVAAVVVMVVTVPLITVEDRNGRSAPEQMHHQPSFDRRTPRVYWGEGAAQDPDSSQTRRSIQNIRSVVLQIVRDYRYQGQRQLLSRCNAYFKRAV